MRQARLTAVLLALVAFLGLLLSVPQPAAADGPIADGAQFVCEMNGGGIVGDIIQSVDPPKRHIDVCDTVGKMVEEKVRKEWQDVWDSVLGDVINSARDAVKWVIRTVLTVALLGPSLDLEATGLFGKDATLAGMLTWLGLVVATFGAMWQMGKMAITGQSKHIGRAMLGWVESTVLSAVGVGMVAILVSAGDRLTTGLVNATFDDGGKAYDRIISVLVPAGVSNPITVLCFVAVLLLIGFVQMVMVFLRQSAIPLQCLLLPVAGGGRVGGDTTRQWAPRLITSICVTIVYKPLLAVIICAGFAEFGNSHTLAEWLRGCATLLLAVIAPAPLTRIFAPFGEAVGGGMAAGGMSGAMAGAGSFLAGRISGNEGDSGGHTAPTTAMEHSRYVEQSMGRQNGSAGRDGQSGEGDRSRDIQEQTAPAVPRQPGTEGAAGAGAGAGAGQAAAGTGAATGAAAAAGSAGVAIQVLDGVNNAAQGASGQIGNGGNPQ